MSRKVLLLVGFVVRFAIPTLLLVALLGFPSSLIAQTGSLADPIPISVDGGPTWVAIDSNQPTWLLVSFVPSSDASHFELETTGDLDTALRVFPDASSLQRSDPIAEDDDSGQGANAKVQAALGYPSAYRVEATSRSTGMVQVQARSTREPVERCNWPAGCSLSLASQGQPSASEFLRILRRVRDELLDQSERGRRLEELYWRLGRDLVRDLVFDREFREDTYSAIQRLLPLAHEALATLDGTGGRFQFRRSHHTELRRLQLSISARLSPSNREDLEALWNDFDLERWVDQPLEAVLEGTGLLPTDPDPVLVLFKLHEEPRLSGSSDKVSLSTGRMGVDSALHRVGFSKLRRIHDENSSTRAAGLTRTLRVEVENRTQAEGLVDELSRLDSVEWAEIGPKMRIFDTVGEDPYRSDLWGLDAVGASAAWNVTRGTCATRVAIVDTGFRAGLADVEGRLLEDLGRDFANDDSDPHDGHGHGTHVGGTVAASLGNATSIAGLAPGVCLFAVKVLTDEGDGDVDDVAAGIQYAADMGASIINLSLGCDCDPVQTIEDALVYAVQRGAVVVAAAGNDSLDYLGYPASSSRAIAVGAVDSDLELADFSNRGEGLDLVAPGVEVASLFPDGESCLGNGTSMAAPHVSAVAALLRTVDPSLNHSQVNTRLRDSARDLGPPGWDSTFGAGLVDAGATLAGVDPVDPCPGDSCLELQSDRFQVTVDWQDFEGNRGTGHAVSGGSNDSGLMWFFRSSNWEMLVKVIEGCGFNDHFWVFAAATTDVAYQLRVLDRWTGDERIYSNPLGVASPAITDTSAFATCSVNLPQQGSMASGGDSRTESAARTERLEAEGPEVLPRASCGVGQDRQLCFAEGRFRAEVTWEDASGVEGIGRAAPLGSQDSGLFWFFNPANWEMLIKVVNGCSFNQHYWVFAAATTDVGYRLRVIDGETGAVASYSNPVGRAAPAITDTLAIPCQ